MAGGRLQQVPANTPTSLQIAIINNNFAALDNQNVTKIYYDKNGVPTIIEGVLPDGTTGFVVAKPGINVLSLF